MIPLSDLTRDVWGIPCGVECTREAQARWSHYYAIAIRTMNIVTPTANDTVQARVRT